MIGIEYKVEVSESIHRVEIDGKTYQHRQIHTWIGNKARWWKRVCAKYTEWKLSRPHVKGIRCAVSGGALTKNPYKKGSVNHDEFILGFMSVTEPSKVQY